MSDQIVQFIQEKYNERAAKNSRYSLRAFAKDLNIEHSILSKILAKKRNLTFETANKILSGLSLQASIKNSLLLTISDSTNYAKGLEDQEFVTLSEFELDNTYKWYYYAFLSALEVKNVEPTLDGIASYLGLDIKTSEDVAHTLKKLGAVEEDHGQLRLTGMCYTSTNEVKSEALIKAHADHIDLSKVYLDSEERKSDVSDYSGITVAVPKQKLDEAKRRIKEFRRSFAIWISQDDVPKTDVYRLNIQLFPLNKK